MPEDGTQGQAPTDSTPQAGDSATDGAGTGAAADRPDGDITTSTGPAHVDEELRRARDDAAKYRTQLREAQKSLTEAQKREKEREDAEKTELQKAIDKSTDLEAKLLQAENKRKQLALRSDVLVSAQKLGVVDPDAAFRLLDADRVEYDGDKPTNIEDLLKSLIEDKPYLKGKSSGGAAPSTSTTQPASPAGKALTMEDVGRMTDNEINERWEEVQKVMTASGKR